MRIVLVMLVAVFSVMPAGLANVLHRGDAAAAVDPAGGAQEALRVAARLRGVPDATVVDLATELHLGKLDLRSAVAAYYWLAVGIPLTRDQLDHTMAQLDTLAPSYQQGILELLAAMTEARQLREEAFSALGPGDVRFVDDVTSRAMADPASVDPLDAARAVAILGRIDAGRMLHAAAVMLAATEEVAPFFPKELAPMDRIDTAFGALTIGSAGPDVYTEDKQLLIDPGGDDLYLNNQGGVLSSEVFDTTGGCVFGGGTTGRAQPNLGCTPLPSQVCTYDILNNLLGTHMFPPIGLPNHEDPNGPGGGQGNDGSCGSDERRQKLFQDLANINNDADSRGVAALLDLDGSDTYTIPWSHDDALFGLVDFCFPGERNRVNTNRDLFQGGTLAGVGLLYDEGLGDDVYRGRLNAQGSGHVGGVGMLVTKGRGDDLFWADRLSQGDGVAAAVGLLVNLKNGSQTYLLDAPAVYRNEFRPNGRDCAQEGRAGQAQGGFLGVGVLWNHHDGTSVYRAVTQLTSEAYPYAALRDGAGAPLLVAGNDAQGSGESFPIIGTPGGLVIGVGLLFDVTDHADTTCDGAGMLVPSSPSTGNSVATHGVVDASCGKFNLPPELETDDLGGALEHILAGAVGVRVVG